MPLPLMASPFKGTLTICVLVDLPRHDRHQTDRKSTRLNSSHGYISYAVFCLKKKNPSYFIAHPSKSLLPICVFRSGLFVYIIPVCLISNIFYEYTFIHIYHMTLFIAVHLHPT